MPPNPPRETPITLEGLWRNARTMIAVGALAVGLIGSHYSTKYRIDDLERRVGNAEQANTDVSKALKELETQLGQLNHKLDLLICAQHPGQCDAQLRVLSETR